MRRLWTLTLVVLLGASSSPGAEPVAGTLEIRYHLAAAVAGDLQPSYQTTIWLEDTGGRLVRSLQVSEWLAWAGFNEGVVCPTWLAVADWGEDMPEEMFDAVTRPTPRLGDQALRVDLAPLALAPGGYRYRVETHVVESYKRFIGFSSMNSADRSKEIIERLHPDVALLAMNPTQYGRFAEIALPAARAKNVGVMAMKVVRNLVGVDGTTAEELMGYSLGQDGVSSAVVGHAGPHTLPWARPDYRDRWA